jgi:hypothetical protein
MIGASWKAIDHRVYARPARSGGSTQRDAGIELVYLTFNLQRYLLLGDISFKSRSKTAINHS